ncbi:MAG: zinc ribbon domain-containing protein [Clostridia bacterium]|nr:zinc ribbon domain-containing protein [Clostridia bacterium]
MADLLQKQKNLEEAELNVLYSALGKACYAFPDIRGKSADVDSAYEAVKSFHAKVALNKRCKTCMALLNEDSKFCTKCGSRVEVEIPCKGCGCIIAEGVKFCPRCGWKVTLDEVNIPVPPNICKECRAPLKEEGARFCAICGARQ